MRTPVEIVNALGLGSTVALEDLANRRRAYDCVHVGQHDVAIGHLIDLLKSEPALVPPRTGHLGNWEDIALGRAGALDFNQAICARGLGYPLITAFTQTEAETPPAGDWVYLPGSVVERGQRTPLPLYTWDGSQLVPRGRERPLFCPFVFTDGEGTLQPLAAVHWQRMRSIPRFAFAPEAQIIADHAAELRPMLAVLLDEAGRTENPRRAFADLIGHAAALDGSIARCEMRRDGAGYWLDDDYYSSTEALVDAALVPFQAVADPGGFRERLAELPRLVPVLSHLAISIFSAIWTTHYPVLDAASRQQVTRPFNAHLHWGARDMAGYPPLRNGYFVERSTTRSLRRMCGALVDQFPAVEPICIVLLPASVFMLCPSSAYPRDVDLISSLLHRVVDSGASIESIVRGWLADSAEGLSEYWLNRFVPRRGVLHTGQLPNGGAACEPDGFRQLTFRQACAIIGALYTALGDVA